MSGVTVRARAKLNLSLDVLEKLPDGYHELRMVMQSCTLADEVSVEPAPAGEYRAFTNRSFIPTGEKNVAVKAAMAMMGTLTEVYRLPLCEMTAEHRDKLRTTLAALNLI